MLGLVAELGRNMLRPYEAKKFPHPINLSPPTGSNFRLSSHSLC